MKRMKGRQIALVFRLFLSPAGVRQWWKSFTMYAVTKKKIVQLVDMCNTLRLDYVHLYDVIDDFLSDI